MQIDPGYKRNGALIWAWPNSQIFLKDAWITTTKQLRLFPGIFGKLPAVTALSQSPGFYSVFCFKRCRLAEINRSYAATSLAL